MKTMLSLATAPPSGQNSNQKAKYPRLVTPKTAIAKLNCGQKYPCLQNTSIKIPAKKFLQKKSLPKQNTYKRKLLNKIDTCGKQSFRVCKKLSDSLFDLD